MPAMRKSPSKASLSTTDSSPSVSSVATTLATTLSVNEKSPKSATSFASQDQDYHPTAMVQAANAALMERTAFVIDEAKDDDDEDEEEMGGAGGADDDHVMDEVLDLFVNSSVCNHLLIIVLQVDAFLEAHDSGLSDADKKVAEGEVQTIVSVFFAFLTLHLLQQTCCTRRR